MNVYPTKTLEHTAGRLRPYKFEKKNFRQVFYPYFRIFARILSDFLVVGDLIINNLDSWALASIDQQYQEKLAKVQEGHYHILVIPRISEILSNSEYRVKMQTTE